MNLAVASTFAQSANERDHHLAMPHLLEQRRNTFVYAQLFVNKSVLGPYVVN